MDKKYFAKTLPIEGCDNGEMSGLFLCSNEYKKGDKCFCLGLDVGNAWVKEAHADSNNGGCPKCIKTYGQILNEGIHSGQEFTEKESSYLTISD